MLHQFNNILPIHLSQTVLGEKSIVVSPVSLLFTLTLLKKHISYQYKLLSCISGVDLLGKAYRFVCLRLTKFNF